MPEPSQTPVSFHAGFYLATNPDVAANAGYGIPEGAGQHFVRHGVFEGRSPNIFFDAGFYLQLYPDLQAAFGPENYAEAFKHWIRSGLGEGRRGSAIFDVQFYISHHPDLVANLGATNWLGGYDHWMRHGVFEGRITAPELNAPLFEPNTTTVMLREPSFQQLIAVRETARLLKRLWDNRDRVKDGIDWIARGVFLRDLYKSLKEAFSTPEDDFQNELDRTIREAWARGMRDGIERSESYERAEKIGRTA